MLQQHYTYVSFEAGRLELPQSEGCRPKNRGEKGEGKGWVVVTELLWGASGTPMYKSQGSVESYMLNPGSRMYFLPKTFESILWNSVPGSFRKTTSGKVYDL